METDGPQRQSRQTTSALRLKSDTSLLKRERLAFRVPSVKEAQRRSLSDNGIARKDNKLRASNERRIMEAYPPLERTAKTVIPARTNCALFDPQGQVAAVTPEVRVCGEPDTRHHGGRPGPAAAAW